MESTPFTPAAVSQTCQSSGNGPMCSSVKRLRSAGFFKAFGPLTKDGAHTGMMSSLIKRSAVSDGQRQPVADADIDILDGRNRPGQCRC